MWQNYEAVEIETPLAGRRANDAIVGGVM